MSGRRGYCVASSIPLRFRTGDPDRYCAAYSSVLQVLQPTSKHFGDPAKGWMLHFRVCDLDKMAAQLQAAGIAIKVDSQTYPNGRFARLHDPEGNPIELWQPKLPSAAG